MHNNMSEAINSSLDTIIQNKKTLEEMSDNKPDYDKRVSDFYRGLSQNAKAIYDQCVAYEQRHGSDEDEFAGTLFCSEAANNPDVSLKCTDDAVMIFTAIPPKTEKSFHGYDAAILAYADNQNIPQLDNYCIHIVHCYSPSRIGSCIRDVDNNDTGFIHTLDRYFKPNASVKKLYESWQPATSFAKEGTYIYIASSFVFLNQPNALVCTVKGGVSKNG